MSGNRQYSLGEMAASRATPQTAAGGIEENLSNPASRPRRKSIAGIAPHTVIIADPQELNAKRIVGAMPKETVLIAELGVHLTVLEAASRRFLFGLGLFPDPLFAKFGFRHTPLSVWGSVATAALDFACQVEAGTVIFTGQDFTFSRNRRYASLAGFLDLISKKAVLKQDHVGVNEAISWGLTVASANS